MFVAFLPKNDVLPCRLVKKFEFFWNCSILSHIEFKFIPKVKFLIVKLLQIYRVFLYKTCFPSDWLPLAYIWLLPLSSLCTCKSFPSHNYKCKFFFLNFHERKREVEVAFSNLALNLFVPFVLCPDLITWRREQDWFETGFKTTVPECCNLGQLGVSHRIDEFDLIKKTIIDCGTWTSR